MRSTALPPGPTAGPLAQTVAFHRDPLRVLRAARARHGDVFTLRLATARPVVVVAARDEVGSLLHADPGAARAGSARRAILPLASPQSVFGADEPRHRAAREPIAPLFAPEAVAARGAAMAAIAERHALAWPRGRPFALLDRMRTLAAELFVRLMLGVDDDRRVAAFVAALRRMLWTPGNPPLGAPGEGDGLIGAAAARAFERRHAPLTRLLAEEVERRRSRAGAPGASADILGRLVRADPRRSGDELAEELLVLLAAAQEPPAAALTRVLDRLGRSPELAERYAARDDARAAIVRETLRLHPAAIAGLRRLTGPRAVAGHRLPAGVVVMVPIPLVHRDPVAWPEPDAFRLERWAAAGEPPPDVFLPFGDGARRCLGEHLARAYLDFVVPAILWRLRLRPLWPRPERMVLRGTILVPHRSCLTAATLR
jgi:cytochrome P450 family 135